ncbi:MAG: hypothetical protein ACOYLP_05385 [Flavobacterium sp.]|uniref:hypothetical protein n=1 Tax=Flavobacterium sp. TaxID=239 RepID=UPI003BE62132
MKKLYFLCSLAFMNFTSKAAIIIVSNNPNIPGQYTSLQTAIDAAAPDDTLYVQGSVTSYGDVTITKKLKIVGSGMLPDNTSHLGTTLGNIYYRVSADGTSSPSGSSITGCNIYVLLLGFSNIGSVSYMVSNISIYRNRISAIMNNGYASAETRYSGIHIFNNIIGTLNVDRLGGNSVVNNNIFVNGVQSTGFIDSGNWVLVNNIIGGISGCYNASVLNNIIYSNYSNYSGFKYCNFTKNLFYSPNYSYDSNFLANPNLNNTFNTTFGNIFNQNPSFVKYDIISDNIYSYSISSPSSGPFVDFHLNNDSPGKNYGTDGTDIGIYGGTTPFVEGATTDSRFRYFPMPAMPQMLDLTITNPSIPANSTLNVNFSAEKKN